MGKSLLICVLFAVTALTVKARETLVFGSPVLPSLLSIGMDGRAGGPIGGILESIFTTAKIPVQFRELPSKRIELDQEVALTGGAKSESREKDWLFSQRPFVEVKICLYWQDLKGIHGQPVASVRDLNGRSVITVLGTDPARDFVQAQAPGTQFIEARTPEAALMMLQNRRAEFLLGADITMDAVLAASNGAKLESMPLKVMPIYLMVRRSRPDAADLLARIDGGMAHASPP